MKKLKLEDICLTIEQAKELENLGISLNDSVFMLLKNGKVVPSNINQIDEWFNFYTVEINTLSNSEMLEMLPRYIEVVDLKGKCRLAYLHVGKDWVCYTVGETYLADGYVYNSYYYEFLRDAIFEMIKFLKTKKLL